MFILASRFFFLFASSGALSWDCPAFSAATAGSSTEVATDEGLQLLQGKASKVNAHEQAGLDMQAKSQAFASLYGMGSGSLKERMVDAVQIIAQRRKEKGGESVSDSHHQASDSGAVSEKADSERALLEVSDMQKVRFRAKHQNWIDILDLYSDGFFSRYHDRDIGIWSLDGNWLILKWLRWGEEKLRSTDGGLTFNQTGDAEFNLRSFFQPIWWSNHFKSIGREMNETSLVDRTVTMNVPAILAAHINCRNVALDEKGYSAVAALKDDSQMETYVRRVADKLGLRVNDEGSLKGMIPYYSGIKAKQTYNDLVAELTRTAHTQEAGWLVDANSS